MPESATGRKCTQLYLYILKFLGIFPKLNVRVKVLWRWKVPVLVIKYFQSTPSSRHKHWPGALFRPPRGRASTFYLSLARTGHLDICRASRFQIVLARTMTNHSMYFLRGPRPTSQQFSRSPFATARRQRGASRSRACQ